MTGDNDDIEALGAHIDEQLTKMRNDNTMRMLEVLSSRRVIRTLRDENERLKQELTEAHQDIWMNGNS